MTILYNSETGKIISKILIDGYKVDGKPFQVNPPIYELNYIDNQQPQIEYHEIADYEWVVDLEYLTYERVWTIRVKTESEMIEYLNNRNLEAIELVKDFAFKSLISNKIASIKEEISILSDDDAYALSILFDPYEVGKSYIQNERFYYPIDTNLYKVLQNHTSQLDWKPNEAVSLYVKISPPGQIDPWVQPAGAHDAYQIGDKVTHNGSTWENTVSNNVWEPGVYGWTQI